MVCSPQRCIDLVESIRARRSQIRPGYSPAIFVWEPVPDLCTPEELGNLQEAARYVNVVSPNGPELNQFFARSWGRFGQGGMIGTMDKRQGRTQRDAGCGCAKVGRTAVGCTWGTKVLHLRAYHQNGVGVVDPTGGGNTYLGALAVGLTEAADLGEAFVDERLFAFCKHKDLRDAELPQTFACGAACDDSSKLCH